MQKDIKFNRQTKDFDCFLNGRYVGSRSSRTEAQALLDQIAHNELTH
jgi:hypothetical protein